jgi:hypothetical protein
MPLHEAKIFDKQLCLTINKREDSSKDTGVFDYLGDFLSNFQTNPIFCPLGLRPFLPDQISVALTN